MGRERLEVWSGLANDHGLRCVILRGEGKHFQAGADLKERNGMSDDEWADQHHLFEAMIRAQLACPVPVIAAVHAAALDPHTAVMVNNGAGVAEFFGWPEPHPDPEPARATWQQVEDATTESVAALLDVLDDDEQAELITLARAAVPS